ncbi:TPA: hypothetical protein ACH3X2_14254 [Trebouxia sp. C0005]
MLCVVFCIVFMLCFGLVDRQKGAKYGNQDGNDQAHPSNILHRQRLHAAECTQEHSLSQHVRQHPAGLKCSAAPQSNESVQGQVTGSAAAVTQVCFKHSAAWHSMA